MSGLLILRALLFAGECFLASLLLPVLAFAAALLLRRRAALRHLVWTSMFGVLAMLPLVALLLPPRRIVEHVAAPVADAAPMVAAPVIAPPPPSLLTPENIVLLLVALWLAGLCWQALRLSVGGFGLFRLRRASAPFAPPLPVNCEVRLSPGEHGPSTFGILRPIVLLPRSAPAWPAARLEAVLRHEAAHVARRDAAVQFIARLVCAVFWPNPLLWLAARSLRRDAEIAADDQVLASGMTPSLYAAELVGLAADRRGVALGVAMAGPPLAKRVEAVLSNNSSRKGVTRMDIAKTATLGLAATLMLGVARFDIAVAQDAPPAPKVERNVEVNVERNEDVEAAAMAGARERNVELNAAANAAAFEARAATIKAGADAVAAKAKAKAAAETDPVRKEQYRRQAVRVVADSEQLKAQADRLEARAKANLAEVEQRAADVIARMPADKARADEAIARAKARLAEMQPRLDDMKQRLAEARKLAQADRASGFRGISGPDADGNYTLQVGQPGNARAEGLRALEEIAPQVQAAIAKALADAHVSEQAAKAVADAHIDEIVAAALQKARPVIDDALRQEERRTVTLRRGPGDVLRLPAPPAPFAPPARPATPIPPAPPPPPN